MRHLSIRVVVVLLAAVGAPVHAAEREVYVGTGEHGERSFSDVAMPGAERLVVETAAPMGDPLAELDRRIEQTLSVANALEASRLVREEARADARARAAEARAASAPQVIYEDRYVSSPYLYPRPGYGRPGYGRPGNGNGWRHDGRPGDDHKPPHAMPNRPGHQTISRKFPALDVTP